MGKLYKVSSNPHIRSGMTTSGIDACHGFWNLQFRDKGAFCGAGDSGQHSADGIPVWAF